VINHKSKLNHFKGICHRHVVLLLLVLMLFSFFIGNGKLAPSIMEARNFITAREMIQNQSWLIPTLNAEYRFEKMPLPTWITALSGLLAGDIYNLAALRFPAGLMATTMVFSLYGLTKTFTNDKLVPVLAAGVLTTSFYVVYMARQATWDIYCHSFMLAGIWSLTIAWKKPGNCYPEFALTGLLMGLSFMSKGPVSFYALLLPFLLAYFMAFKPTELKSKVFGVLLAVTILVVVGGWWPVYIYLNLPQDLAQVVNTETGSWVNRHVRPFWHYWSFPIQSGLWAVLLTAALIYPYAKSRVNTIDGNYRFLWLWVILTIVLLSLIPEKKERYLMPALISKSLLVAYYLRYLIKKNKNYTKTDRAILSVNTALIGMACLAAVIGLFLFGFHKGPIPDTIVIGCSVVMLIFSMLFFIQLFRKNATSIIPMMFCLTAFLSSCIPYLNSISKSEIDDENQLKRLTYHEAVQRLPCYSIGLLRPEELWEIKKIVTPIESLNQVNNKHQSIILFRAIHEDSLIHTTSSKPYNSIAIGTYEHPSQKNEVKWLVSKVDF